MTLTLEQINARLDAFREQALFIQATKEEERSQSEHEWLKWAERRIHALQKEALS
jgi:hypothetical protein